MSEKTGDFIISLAEQGGVELDEAQTKAIQEIATELPEGISTKIQGSLFTKESALANPDILNKIKADSLDAVDSKVLELATTLGLDEGSIHNLKEAQGTYKRIEAMGNLVLQRQKVALEKAKEGAPAGDQEELNKQISELNAQITSHKEGTISKIDHEDTVEGYEDILKENAKDMLQMKANGLFAGTKWASDQVSNDINTAIAMGVFNAELSSKEISLVEKNGILKLETKEGTPYFGADNKEVTPHELAKSLVARDKLEKVTDTKPAGTTTPTTVTGTNGIDASVVGALAQAQASSKTIQDLKEKIA